jgi:hypothetical protein
LSTISTAALPPRCHTGDRSATLGFVEGSTVVAYLEGEGRLVIESPEAIRRALLQEWSEVAGEVSLVDELRAERRAAAAREAEQLQADRAEQDQAGR